METSIWVRLWSNLESLKRSLLGVCSASPQVNGAEVAAGGEAEVATNPSKAEEKKAKKEKTKAKSKATAEEKAAKKAFATLVV